MKLFLFEMQIPVPLMPLEPARDLVPALRSGAKILVDTLIEIGVDTLFGYPGGAVLPLYDALFEDTRLRHVLVRH